MNDLLFTLLIICGPVAWFYLSRRYTPRCTCGHWARYHPGPLAECGRTVHRRNSARRGYTARCECRAWVKAEGRSLGQKRQRVSPTP